jgi:hypothetical protein
MKKKINLLPKHALLSMQSLILIFFSALLTNALQAKADEFDEFDEEDEAIVIYLKKIRDNEGNYLVDVTKAAAKAVSQSGEFQVKRYKRKSYSEGPVINVQSPQFTYEPYKEGMSRKEIASAGLALASDVGELFGFGQKAQKAREAKARMENPNGLLSRMSDKQELLVTMQARVEVINETTGDEAIRKIKFEQVFDNKHKFLEQKELIIQQEIVAGIKMAIVEFIEDME